MIRCVIPSTFFFFNHTATTEIYTLSLHDALPISGFGTDARRRRAAASGPVRKLPAMSRCLPHASVCRALCRSEEHTSELQSHSDLVCRLLLEKKKKTNSNTNICLKIMILYLIIYI